MNLENISDAEQPFTFPVKVGHVSSNPISITIEADGKELEGLAKFWKVIGVTSLKADVKLSRWKRDGVRVSGHFEGKLIQDCVVSLKPINTEINDDFVAFYVPETSKLARQDNIQNGELIIDVDGPDIPDTFSGNTIDVAAVVSEFAAMAIDPYPRDPEAEIDQKFQSGSIEDDAPPSPFAALAAIKSELE
ncbi:MULTISPECIES: YceD family protein [unclassified Lentilitoribacter]|uniref:YceD family protein n=1 Tax=unclassified Lentilitoribacter TaxID=2647570 RepID=UPI0013A6EA5A|nr:DUF177 domain-containing protein [Lentilitoribacter sp. Alg239-R112]